jgi:hypothetical protein
MRTTLASGAWVDHRPIGDLKGKDKRALTAVTMSKLGGAALGGDVVDAAGNMDIPAILASILASGAVKQFGAQGQDAVWALAITGWSYDLPVPEVITDGEQLGEVLNSGSFGEIPLDDCEELEQLFAPYQVKLQRRPDPKGATTSSSNGSSRDARTGSPTG